MDLGKRRKCMCWPNVTSAQVRSHLAQGLRTCDPVDPTFCNFRNHFGWCYIALQPVVTGFGFFRHILNAYRYTIEIQQ